MRAFVATLIVVVVLGLGLAWYIQRSSPSFQEGSLLRRTGELLTPAEPAPLVRTPVSYHILEDQGGIPREEAVQAGLVQQDYAYLAALEPIQISRGIVPAEDVLLRGKPYDLCFRYGSTPPEQQYLEFNLLGQWSELHFGFGFDDAHPSDPRQQWAIEFRVECDGQVALGPQTFTPVDPPVFTKLDVSGVSRVNFIIRRIANGNPFAPVLFDPFVLKTTSDN